MESMKQSNKKVESNEDIETNKALEKARVKAEYRRIMNESSGERTNKGEVVERRKEKFEHKGGNSSKGKRKERVDDNLNGYDVKEGDRVKVKYKDGVWYRGNISSLILGKVGEVVNVGISYDDGEEEESKWPDKDIVIIDSDEGGKEKKKKVRKNNIGSGINVLANKSDKVRNKKVRRIEVGSGVNEIDVEGEGVFYCNEGECEYYSKRANCA
jgi:hypothetical protein